MIDTRQGLADFCLRQLGGGVVNIEISEEQIDDNLTNAIQFYQEFHFDGIERDYVIRKITGTILGFADVVGLSIGDAISNNDGSTTSSIIAIDTITKKITIDKIKGTAFTKSMIISNGTVSKTITSVVLGDVDNKYIEVEDSVVGVLRVLNINKLINTTEYLFDAKYQIMMNEIRNLTSGSTAYFYGMMNYLGHLEFILNKEKDFRFNRRMNRIYLDINWGSDLNIGDVITIEVYRALDEDTWAEIMNDIWLKRYTTALLKRQWGTNLKKYQGMQLPGGLTYNGQQIFDEAIVEIKELEQEAREMSAPLSFMVG